MTPDQQTRLQAEAEALADKRFKILPKTSFILEENFVQHRSEMIRNKELWVEAYIAGRTKSVEGSDFSKVLQENLAATKLGKELAGKELGYQDIWDSNDPFDVVIETYEDMISIYNNSYKPHSNPVVQQLREALEPLLSKYVLDKVTAYVNEGVSLDTAEEISQELPEVVAAKQALEQSKHIV